MPNWCSNTIEIQGPSELIDGIEQFLEEKNGKDWFDFFSPTPDELKETTSPNRNEENSALLVEKYGASDWYSWNVENWGCKWNCDAQDWTRDDDNTLSFWFDSPWGPPTALYDFISNGDWNVEAQYHEEGMCFVGEYIDGSDDSYEYSDLDSLDDIPEHIVENWNLREMLEDREDWEEEEEFVDEDDEENENGKSS